MSRSYGDYADRFSKLNRCVEELGETLRDLSSDGKTTLQDISAVLAPRESAELNLCLAMALISLLESQFATQGVDSKRHQIHREIQRLKSYISKLTTTERDQSGDAEVVESDDNS